MQIPLNFYNATLNLLDLVEADLGRTAGYPDATRAAAVVLRSIVANITEKAAYKCSVCGDEFSHAQIVLHQSESQHNYQPDGSDKKQFADQEGK